MKLFILRIILIIVMAILQPVTLIIYRELHLPMRWLLHYLVGSGRTMTVPTEIIKNASSALLRAIEANSYGYITPGLAGRKYCVYHSTVYDGSGFKGRPTLFYLLGGFTFTVSKITKKSIFVSGTDQYDWHTTTDWEGKKNYFCSPISSNKIIKICFRFLGYIFGDQYFTDSCWPCSQDQAGISNQLWEDLEKAGARPFISIFDNVEIKGDEVEELLHQTKEDKIIQTIDNLACTKADMGIIRLNWYEGGEEWYQYNKDLPIAIRAEQTAHLLAAVKILPKCKTWEEIFEQANKALKDINGQDWRLESPWSIGVEE